jgi:two-component system, OmpR family, response regulator
MRILVVEDDPILGPNLCDLLEISGHQAVLAKDPATGLAELTCGEQCHAVLLDLQLGEERGERLVTEARSKGLTVPPVVILSAQPAEQLRKAADEVESFAIVQKPFRMEVLLDALRRISREQP